MRLFLLLLVAGGIYVVYQTRLPSTSTDPDVPLQTDVYPWQLIGWSYHDWRIIPLARYSIAARVLHIHAYVEGRESEISPLDFALGWKRMADPTVYGTMDISQDGRFFYWRCKKAPPLPLEEIVSCCANTHLVPASPLVLASLQMIKAGDLIQLTGYLIQAQGTDNFVWTSSLTRDDTGEGACELMWVDAATKL